MKLFRFSLVINNEAGVSEISIWLLDWTNWIHMYVFTPALTMFASRLDCGKEVHAEERAPSAVHTKGSVHTFLKTFFVNLIKSVPFRKTCT